MLFFQVYTAILGLTKDWYDFCEAGLVTNDISLTAGNKWFTFTYIDSQKEAAKESMKTTF